jgi:23S rRNA (guanosine2251-2'-O)-methyltransferase
VPIWKELKPIMGKQDQTIYGIHPILEAIDAGKTIDKVLVQRGLSPETLHKILPALKSHDIPFQFAPKIKLDKVTSKNHQGVIAMISPIEFQEIEWLIPNLYEEGETPLILVLDRISDIRNFGAICRSAECAGVHAIVIPSKGAAQINADAIKSSAGALLRLPICRSFSIGDTINFLKQSGLATMACHEKGTQPYYQADLTVPIAIVMGSEEDGISNNVDNATEHSIFIPMKGKTDSLNVSVATAIILFDAVRQRLN